MIKFFKTYWRLSKTGFALSIDIVSKCSRLIEAASRNTWRLMEHHDLSTLDFRLSKKLFDRNGTFIRQVDLYWYIHDNDEQYFFVDDSAGVLPQRLEAETLDLVYEFMLSIVENLEKTQEVLHGGRVYITENGAIMTDLG